MRRSFPIVAAHPRRRTRPRKPTSTCTRWRSPVGTRRKWRSFTRTTFAPEVSTICRSRSTWPTQNEGSDGSRRPGTRRSTGTRSRTAAGSSDSTSRQRAVSRKDSTRPRRMRSAVTAGKVSARVTARSSRRPTALPSGSQDRAAVQRRVEEEGVVVRHRASTRVLVAVGLGGLRLLLRRFPLLPELGNATPGDLDRLADLLQGAVDVLDRRVPVPLVGGLGCLQVVPRDLELLLGGEHR